MQVFLTSIPLFFITAIGLLTAVFEVNPFQSRIDAAQRLIASGPDAWRPYTIHRRRSNREIDIPYNQWCILIRRPSTLERGSIYWELQEQYGPIKSVTLEINWRYETPEYVRTQYKFLPKSECSGGTVRDIEFQAQPARRIQPEFDNWNPEKSSNNIYDPVLIKNRLLELGYFTPGTQGLEITFEKAVIRWQLKNGYVGALAQGVLRRDQYKLLFSPNSRPMTQP